MKVVHMEQDFLTLRMEPVTTAMVSFKVYCFVGGSNNEFLYVRKDSETGNDFTENLEETLVFCSGNIKWDGCTDIQFDEQETGMLHFCGYPSKQFSAMFDGLYKLALGYLPQLKDRLTEK